MLRIETVYARLLELTKEGGISAGDLAQSLGLARANVSNDLNRLWEEGRATKEGTKPILYRGQTKAVARPESVFDRLVAKAPSMTQAAEQAKAAVLYPPRGMPVLLLGGSGAGKSRFAETIHAYALEMGRLKPGAPLIVFNCADYASNPQLLLSHLFGARKGAFTGAEADSPGIVEKADGGILFLDEVHRLPPEGQEMLFTFFDRGRFRRLGDTETERRAEVLLVAATTEAPASALLQTFTRRIPMVIKIPSLAERSTDERYELIQGFFVEEAGRLSRPIRVSVNAMKALLSYACPNNVGQLKSDIQLLCARAYSDLITGKAQAIELSTGSLPPGIKEGLVSETCHRLLWRRFDHLPLDHFDFEPGSPPTEAGQGWKLRNGSVYDLLKTRSLELTREGLAPEAIEDGLNEAIKGFFSQAILQARDQEGQGIRDLVGGEIDEAVGEILDLASARLGRPLPRLIRNGLALHVMHAISRVRLGQDLGTPDFARVRKAHPEEFAAAVEALKVLDRRFGLAMPLEEASLLAMFFVYGHSEEAASQARPAILVLAHGRATASSMAEVCNELLGVEVVEGIDVPLSEKPRAAYERVKESLESRRPKTDLLLLVDMGSLTSFGPDLEAELGIRVRTLGLVSTLHVLQASRKALLGQGLDEIWAAVREVDGLAQGEAQPQAREGSACFLVAACTTGEGSAQTIRQRLAEALGPEGRAVDIVTASVLDRGAFEATLAQLASQGTILGIVSPFKLGLAYREFPLDALFSESGAREIRAKILEEVLFNKILEAQAQAYTAIDGRRALTMARSFVEAVEAGLGCRLLDGPRVGVLCHLAAMLDRLSQGGAVLPFPAKEAYRAANEDAFALVRNEASCLEEGFGLRLSSDEVCRILGFFTASNCEAPGLVRVSLP